MRKSRAHFLRLFLLAHAFGWHSAGHAQLAPGEPPERMQSLSGNFIGQTERLLRYFPDGTDFVITNGAEFFNRPLYCLNSPFRMDGGDKPELSLYLPGRGGNLRFGVRSASGTKWLNDGSHTVTRYRPGSLRYEIRDPSLGNGIIRLVVLPASDTRALLARVELANAEQPVELIWAFGGANGMRGRRNGDIGCEREPVSTFFQLQPDQCRDHSIVTSGNAFRVDTRTASLEGVASTGAMHFIADASHWNSLADLLNSKGDTNQRSVVVGQLMVTNDSPAFLAIEQQIEGTRSSSNSELTRRFAEAEARRASIASKVVVDTPDAFINAAVAALNVAADGVWDEQRPGFMHGAVAWRNRLLGWRGVYSGDALGWHDRTRRHLQVFADQQNIQPIPEKLPAPEESANLSRNETALHSNGNMTKNHYDMNLVAVDAFFRHLLWTGDKQFAREYWPTLVRHLAWERRMFRREFGPDKLPLYEGYACFWASDDVAYNGGGAALSSAYNYCHNKMATRVAQWIGEDAADYEHEAELIARAMRSELWLPERGWFAEFKDWLGLQLVHPVPGVWSFYHTIDSALPTPQEAWQMTRLIESEIPHIPISGPNVPAGCFTIPTSTWMPYAWSVNNVVMAEVTHTALACWQANRRELAFPLFKGAVLDSMFIGLCPGNVGMCTEFDAYRHESQRDFADGVGATSRALIEGLFGIKPDALAGELTLRPGFPADWDHAKIEHPDFSFSFMRRGARNQYHLEQKFAEPMAVKLQVIQEFNTIYYATVNGEPTEWRMIDRMPGMSWIEIDAPAQKEVDIVVHYTSGASRIATPSSPSRQTQRAGWETNPSTFDWKFKLPDMNKAETLNLINVFNDKVTQIFRNEYLSPRSPFVSLALPKQGIGSWCLPTAAFTAEDSGLRALARQSDGKFTMPNGVPFATPAEPDVPNIAFVSQWDNYPREISLPLSGKSSRALLLMAGSSNPMQTRIDNGEVIVTYADGSTSRLPLHNPTTWWPIEQDYFVDDYAFRYDGELPARVDLATGKVRVLEMSSFKGRGGKVPGGAATALHLPLDATKELKSLTVRALANEVVIGLMSVTLVR